MRRGVLVHTLIRVGAYDAIVTVALAVLWSILGILPFAMSLALSAPRVIVWVWTLRRLLAPVTSLGPEDGWNNQEVIAADTALQRLDRSFGLNYILGWVCVTGLGVALAATGVTGLRGLPEAELFSALLLAIAVLLATSGRVAMVIGGALIDPRLQISAALHEQGLAHHRSQRSLLGAMAAKRMLVSMGIMVGLGGIGGITHVHGVRQTALVELQRRVELSALRVDSSRGVALDGVELVDEPALPELLALALDGAQDGSSVVAFDPQRDLALAAAPTADGRWALALADPDEHLGAICLIVLGITLLSMLTALLGDSAQNKEITAPIEQLTSATRAFVERGELRALARVVPLDDNELGRLAVNFNDMLDMLTDLARAAETVASGDMSVELEHPGELHDAFRGMIARLTETVVHLRLTSRELAATATELRALSLQQHAAEHEQSANIQRVSAAVVSLAGSATDIAVSAKGALRDAEQAVSTTDQMIQKIAELRTQTASVSELLEAIRGIADRSDLLALNGSLEATRAGEAGRGFALVAGEMRRLAERVTGTLNDVRERLGAIDASSAATVEVTAESRDLIARVAAAMQTISAVTERQSGHTTQAATDVQSVEAQVTAAAAATSRARAASEGLHEHAVQLEHLTARFRVPSDEAPSA